MSSCASPTKRPGLLNKYAPSRIHRHTHSHLSPPSSSVESAGLPTAKPPHSLLSEPGPLTPPRRLRSHNKTCTPSGRCRTSRTYTAFPPCHGYTRRVPSLSHPGSCHRSVHRARKAGRRHQPPKPHVIDGQPPKPQILTVFRSAAVGILVLALQMVSCSMARVRWTCWAEDFLVDFLGLTLARQADFPIVLWSCTRQAADRTDSVSGQSLPMNEAGHQLNLRPGACQREERSPATAHSTSEQPPPHARRPI